MWKDIVKTVAALVAMFLGFVLLIGFVVPREHEARCEALVEKRPRDVWESLSDVEGWSQWMPGVELVLAAAHDAERPTFQVTGPAGTTVVEVLESERPERLVLVWTGAGFSRRRTFVLSTLRNLTRISVTESGDRENAFDRGWTFFDDPHDEVLELLSKFATHLGVSTIPEIVKQ